MKPIPISAARKIAEAYGYDQVVIFGRRVGKRGAGGEHLTTYGKTTQHCEIAALVGEFLMYKIMGWHRDEEARTRK